MGKWQERLDFYWPYLLIAVAVLGILYLLTR